MKTVNERLRDLLLRRAVRRTRLENHCVRTIDQVWRMMSHLMTTTISRSLLFRGDRELAHVVDVHALTVPLSQFRDVFNRGVAEIERCLDSDLGDLARVELLSVPTAIQAVLDSAVKTETTSEAIVQEQEGLGVRFDSVPAGAIAQLITSPLGGATYQRSFSDLSTRMQQRLRNALIGGLSTGQSVQQVTSAVRGLLNNSRFEAARIVRTEYTRVSNQSALLTYQRNRDVIKSVMWVSTLDKATCMTCASLDGKTWPTNKARIPGVSTHPNCRCTLVPVVKSARDLGLTSVSPGTRAAFDGQVPGTQRYPEWFAQQSDAFKREVLGPTRFALYQSGRASIRDFAGLRGTRPVSSVLRRLESPAKFDPDDYLSDEELQAERFARRETEAQRKARISQKQVDPETAAAMRRALGIEDAPKGFQPAPTIEAAQQYAKQTLGIRSVTMPKTWGYDVANTVNDALTTVKNAGGVMPKRLVIREGAGKATKEGLQQIASYRAGTIYVNADSQWFQSQAIRNRMASSRWLASKDARHVVIHEMGHAMHATTSRATFNRLTPAELLSGRKRETAYLKITERVNRIGMRVSRYAASDPREFVAETYAGLVQGIKYPPDVMNLYRELGGPKIGATVRGSTGKISTRGADVALPYVGPRAPRLPSTTARAWQGRTINTKYRIGGKGRTKELGDFGEEIARSYLQSTGAIVEKTNGIQTNYPIDAVARRDGKILAYEIKAGEVHNQPGSSNWRLKIGLPSQTEQAWLKKASAKQKAAWTQRQFERIFDRKIAGLQEISKKYGKAIRVSRVRNASGITVDVTTKGQIEARTLAMIINSDTGLVDVFEFEGFHKYVGWKGRATAQNYVGSFSYKGRMTPSLIRNTAGRR